MSSVHDAMRLYYETRNLALAAQIHQGNIEKANLVYARLHVLIIRAKSAAEAIPALQDAIMNLPTELIAALGIGYGFDDVRDAILGLPRALMDALSPAIEFDAAPAA